MVSGARSSVRLHVSGVVQGVGFRPFVHRLAARHQLGGWVRNTSGDVEIAAEGDSLEVDEFIMDLRREAPPLARIDRLDVENVEPRGLTGFSIHASNATSARGQLVAPDVAICEACERELRDPKNRRYRYPFITCTDCGPRYSVIEAMPYDRSRTSMRAFIQCPECQREYESLGDRRYHSETNSCPTCGPRLEFLDEKGRAVVGEDPILSAARALESGAIVAIRGLGGFHLAADATNEAAVRRLRERKRRDGKPFAVMVASIPDACQLAEVSPDEAQWLRAPARPIVILKERSETAVVPSVGDHLGTIGVMLAYTPMHLLLLDAVDRPLVMTSGNPSGEPLAASIAEAMQSLGDIADGYLMHNREIVARVDDSVMRVSMSGAIMMRRARGFAPLPMRLPVASPLPLIAVGPHLKNTLTLATGSSAFMSPHLGDLETIDTEDHWYATYELLKKLFGIEPRVAVRDLHPQYLSTRIAQHLDVERVIAVQHHHAHIAAVLAEHDVVEKVIGVAFDGTGYGDDGNTWGAEILVSDLCTYRRAAQLRYAPLAGGDRAARSPWRCALGYATLGGNMSIIETAVEGVPKHEVEAATRQIEAKFNAPLASSMGRLFDAASAILGIARESRFEGEAAMRLESAAGRRTGRILPFDAVEIDGRLVLDPLPLLTALHEEHRRGVSVADLAAAFHTSVAEATASLVAKIAEQEAIATVALGGGVFQNARLLDSLGTALTARGLSVLLPRQLSPNDGAVSYGQAVVAAARLDRGLRSV